MLTNYFRFTLEKYVSDYCNIKTNTGTAKDFSLEKEIPPNSIPKEIQAFRYLISSSISANNAMLRLLVKKAAQFKHLNGFVANLGSVAIVFQFLII